VVSFPVMTGTTYYVIVDGLENDMYSYGYFNLYVTVK
jgi:hypothetical protein